MHAIEVLPGLQIAHRPGLGELRCSLSTFSPSQGLLDMARPPEEGRPYGRRVLFADEGLEAMVACWALGVSCAPHDHGEANGGVLVLSGRARHTVWGWTPGQLTARLEEEVGPGGLLLCGPDMIHSMVSIDPTAPLITLHVYGPCIPYMMVWDLVGERTLKVDGGCGAWIPDGPDAHLLVETRAGMHRRL